MKTLEKSTKKIPLALFSVMIFIGSLNVSAQDQSTFSEQAHQADVLYASSKIEHSDNAEFIFHNPLKNERFEKPFVAPNDINIEITKFKLMEAMEVTLENDMVVQEWMMTNFSISANTIACQPISAEPVLEVENWMVSDSAWDIE